MLIHVQILRFVAAAAVVAFHAWGVAPAYIAVPGDRPSWGLEHAGHGVDLFFVISGFIIFYATHRSPMSPGTFLRRRMERIIPLYYFVILVVVALAWLIPTTFGTPGWFTPQHILKSLAFVSFSDGEMPVGYVGWSLEYEMYFYLAAALLMALTRNPWRNIVVLFSALVVAGQIPGVRSALGNYAFFVDPLFLEFAMGVLAGGVFVNGRVSVPALVAATCAIAMLLVFDPDSRAIVFGLPSAALVAGAAYLSRWRARPSWIETILARLGDASYSIYLAQVNTISLACKYTAQLIPGISFPAIIVVATCIGIAAGMLLNILVERPLLRFCRGVGAPRLRSAQA